MPVITTENRFLQKVFPEKSDVGRDFYLSSRLHRELSRTVLQRMAVYNLDPTLFAQSTRHGKRYPGNPVVDLRCTPYAVKNLQKSISDVLMSRESVREFQEKFQDFGTFSAILSYSCGLNGRKGEGESPLSFRVAPSAGALYPIEVYVCVMSVADIPQGLYHHDVSAGKLELLRKGNLQSELVRTFPGSEGILQNATFLIVLTACFNRTTQKYGARGYRFIFLDAGHIGQNLYLTATALGVGCTTLGGGYDLEIAGLLGIDGTKEGFVYAAVFGYPRQSG